MLVPLGEYPPIHPKEPLLLKALHSSAVVAWAKIGRRLEQVHIDTIYDTINTQNYLHNSTIELIGRLHDIDIWEIQHFVCEEFVLQLALPVHPLGII